MTPHVREVSVLEAKDCLGELLDWVESGGEVVITRDAKPIARLMPFGPNANLDQASRAAAEIRAMSKKATLGSASLKGLVAKGRL